MSNITDKYTCKLQHVGMVIDIATGALKWDTIYSHKDVYRVVLLAKAVGISSHTISTAFMGWTTQPRWLTLTDPEYVYLTMLEDETLVDMGRFICSYPSIFNVVRRMCTMTEFRSNPEKYIEMLIYFSTYDFAKCFSYNDESVKARIAALTEERATNWDIFTVDPYSIPIEYFNVPYGPSPYPIWSCEGISPATPIAWDQPAIAPYDEAISRIKRFTYGLIDGDGRITHRNGRRFPQYYNAIIAGGCPTRILAANYIDSSAQQSDVDIFIYGTTKERSNAFINIIAWFKDILVDGLPGHVYYAVNSAVTTVYIRDIQRKYQIVTLDLPNPYAVVARFDLTHIQWCMQLGRFWGSPMAFKAMRERISRVCSADVRVERLIKALHCGYSIYREPAHGALYQTIMPDISPLLADPIQMHYYMRKLYNWYHPQGNPAATKESERMHILCMIEHDSGAPIVTDDPATVLDHVNIAGSIHDYISINYTTFNVAGIVNLKHITRHPVLLKSKRGIIRYTTSTCIVRGLRRTELGFSIIVGDFAKVFREFCTVLESIVYPIYSGTTCPRHILNDVGEMTFTLTKARLEKQLEHHFTYLKTRQGTALNIEEDLVIFDTLNITFTIVLSTSEGIVLRPCKFIRLRKNDEDPTTEDVHNDDAHPDTPEPDVDESPSDTTISILGDI